MYGNKSFVSTQQAYPGSRALFFRAKHVEEIVLNAPFCTAYSDHRVPDIPQTLVGVLLFLSAAILFIDVRDGEALSAAEHERRLRYGSQKMRVNYGRHINRHSLHEIHSFPPRTRLWICLGGEI